MKLALGHIIPVLLTEGLLDSWVMAQLNVDINRVVLKHKNNDLYTSINRDVKVSRCTGKFYVFRPAQRSHQRAPQH